jgi:hypothetical protein
MPRKRRDYRAEYQRRIARGIEKGRTRSQARGHPRAAEPYASGKTRAPGFSWQLEKGVAALRKKGSLTAAAREGKVSPERLRRYLRELDFAEKRGGRWVVGPDPWLRTVLIYSNGKKQRIVAQGYEPAALAGSYWNAVGEFLATNDFSHLAPFEGVQINDAVGRAYTLETRPNVLYRLDSEGMNSFEQVYRFVV